MLLVISVLLSMAPVAAVDGLCRREAAIIAEIRALMDIPANYTDYAIHTSQNSTVYDVYFSNPSKMLLLKLNVRYKDGVVYYYRNNANRGSFTRQGEAQRLSVQTVAS